MTYKLVGSTSIAGVRIWLWRRGQYLYLEVKNGPRRYKIYLGKAEAAGGGQTTEAQAEAPCAECWDLLREVAEDYNEAVEIAKRTLREAQSWRDYREALSVIADGSRALRQALRLLGRAEGEV